MKRNVPLAIRRMIEEDLGDNVNLIKIEYSDDFIVQVTEKTDVTPNYFRVIDTKTLDGKTIYTIKLQPAGKHSAKEADLDLDYYNLQKRFQTWVEVMAANNEYNPLFDDPIIQSYYEEIGPKFEVLDTNADRVPFSPEQQGYLLGIYDKVAEQVRAEMNETNKVEADTLLKAIEAAKANVSKETKRDAMQRLQRIAAMGMKYSFYIGKLIMEGLVVTVALKMLGVG